MPNLSDNPDQVHGVNEASPPLRERRHLPPSRPVRFAWPLIIALSACGGGGGGGGSPVRPVIKSADREEIDAILPEPVAEFPVTQTKVPPLAPPPVPPPSVVKENRLPDISFVQGDTDLLEISIPVTGSQALFKNPTDETLELSIEHSGQAGSSGLRIAGNVIYGPLPDVGIYTIRVKATRPSDKAYDFDEFRLIVRPQNLPPEVSERIPDQYIDQGAFFRLDLNGFFRDPENHGLRFTGSGLPNGFTIQPNGTWLHTNDEDVAAPGQYVITIEARDIVGGGTAQQKFILTIMNPQPRTLRVTDVEPIPGMPNVQLVQETLTGQAEFKDVFDISEIYPDAPVNVHQFDPGRDRLFISRSDVFISAKDSNRNGHNESVTLYADREKTEALAVVWTQVALTSQHFDADDLDPNLPDTNVTVHYLPDIP